MSATQVAPEPVPERATDTTEDERIHPNGRAGRGRAAHSVLGRWTNLLRHPIVTSLTPAVVFLTVRELGLLVLDWMAGRHHVSATSALTSWDGQWYLGIATGGYAKVPPGLVDAFGQRRPETPLAFFPGYPLLVRLLSELTGVAPLACAFVVTLGSGVACAYALDRIGRLVRGGSPGAGLALVALFAASPMAVVLSMTYSEATFCALAAWSLVAVLRRRWLPAGACCAAAGLVRPTAVAVMLAVGAAAGAALLHGRDRWRPLAAALLAPLGLVGYLAWVAMRTGRWDGWFVLQQRGWDSRFDGGAATVRFGLDTLATGRSVLEATTVWLLLGLILLLVIGLRQRLDWPLLLYGALVLAIDLGSNGLMNSKARLALPAFTLLLPVALALAKRRPSTAVAVLAGLALFSAWFGAYALTGWPYAI
ncbi:hypothetical protein [Gandjariella thermophila]|uniref:Membrane protein n=1 Tax=Gandjariella thermophila TaxID=1931992 RepID=A0A4D4J6F7_9PSEU|nr:hypothetical protein [Gandjariella thermophila]GDY30692.1 membrane protein [Gandjariella thermophila]